MGDLQTRAQIVEEWYGFTAAAPPPPPPAPAKAPAAAPEPPPPPPPGEPAATDVPNDTVCADPDCAHLASAHGDTTTGDNAGTCGMKNCDCVGMRVPDQTNLDDGEPGGPATPPPAQAAVDPSRSEE